MANLSYIVETNGENGVTVLYHILDYIPQDVVWNSTNTIQEGSDLPDPVLSVSPEYVRRMENGLYVYYRRVIFMPSKSATFSLYVLSDEAHVEYTYESYSSFLTLFRQGDALLVKSKTNVSGDNLNGVISIVSNLSGETFIIPVIQEYTPVRMRLLSYTYEGVDGEENGTINDVSFEYTFNWLTSKTSPDKEILEIEVLSTGSRNGYIIRDVSEYVYAGELDSSYTVSGTTGNYYHTTQTCDGENILMVSEEVIFDTLTEGVYKKVKYNSDLKIVKNKNFLKIINYGRCFLQDDAYYVITLSNVDDLNENVNIIIRYVDKKNDEIIFVNPDMYLENGNVMLETDNIIGASNYFNYNVTMEDGQLVFKTSDPEILYSYIINNELISIINT